MLARVGGMSFSNDAPEHIVNDVHPLRRSNLAQRDHALRLGTAGLVNSPHAPTGKFLHHLKPVYARSGSGRDCRYSCGLWHSTPLFFCVPGEGQQRNHSPTIALPRAVKKLQQSYEGHRTILLSSKIPKRSEGYIWQRRTLGDRDELGTALEKEILPRVWIPRLASPRLASLRFGMKKKTAPRAFPASGQRNRRWPCIRAPMYARAGSRESRRERLSRQTIRFFPVSAGQGPWSVEMGHCGRRRHGSAAPETSTARPMPRAKSHKPASALRDSRALSLTRAAGIGTNHARRENPHLRQIRRSCERAPALSASHRRSLPRYRCTLDQRTSALANPSPPPGHPCTRPSRASCCWALRGRRVHT